MAFTKYDVVSTTVPSGATQPVAGVQIPSWVGYVGMLMPAISPSGTLKLQVSTDNATWFDLYDRAGNQVPYWTANSGPRALAMFDCAGILSWEYVRPVLSAAQNADVIFRFTLHKFTN